MTRVTVVRQLPHLVSCSCSVCSSVPLESDLAWLELNGAPVECLEPGTTGTPEESCPEIAELWRTVGRAMLPLIVGGGRVLSRSHMPTRYALVGLVSTSVRGCSIKALRCLVELAAATGRGRLRERAQARARADEAGFDAVEEGATQFVEHLRARP